MTAALLHGDCLEQLRTLPDNSVDAVVTDPPYGLAFMGKRWDYDVPSVAIWAECLRVLKPGGHLLAFAGTRTQHRMAVRIEDAGFEIRDMIAWVYGSGFPKSLDVSKAIDKVNGETDRLHRFTAWMRTTGVTASQVNTATGTFMGSHYLTAGSQPAIPTPELWTKLRPLCGEVPEWVDKLVERIAAEREVVGTKRSSIGGTVAAGERNEHFINKHKNLMVDITAPATDAAKQWSGWGTALKPALEPITVARKPLCGTVAENVQQHGTGALNVDGCRVESSQADKETMDSKASRNPTGNAAANVPFVPGVCQPSNPAGRWPANLIHDGSEEVTALFPVTVSGAIHGEYNGFGTTGIYGGGGHARRDRNASSGSAARFFYTAKCSKKDRNEGLDGIRTVKHTTGLCKSENMELAQLLQKATSGLTVKWGIDEYGESITGLCLSGFLSTTLTEISKITTLQICNLWMHLPTSESTADANCGMVTGGNLAESAEKSKQSPVITMSEKEAESAHGAKGVVSKMLSSISDEGNWKPATNFHATVKPTDLMRYLCRLVTPPGGVVLDPFMGSGSTGKAAILEGFRFIGCEREAEYVEIARARIAAAESERAQELPLGD